MVSTTVSKTVSQGSSPCTSAKVTIPSNRPNVRYDSSFDTVIKSDNIYTWTFENQQLWFDLYQQYYAFDNRVVQVFDFVGNAIFMEPISGFTLNDETKLRRLSSVALVDAYNQVVSIWNNQLRFRSDLIPSGSWWYHIDCLPQNFIWSSGVVRLIDPDSFGLGNLVKPFSRATKFPNTINYLERLINEKINYEKHNRIT